MKGDSPREVGKPVSEVLASAEVLNAIAHSSSRTAWIFGEEPYPFEELSVIRVLGAHEGLE